MELRASAPRGLCLLAGRVSALLSSPSPDPETSAAVGVTCIASVEGMNLRWRPARKHPSFGHTSYIEEREKSGAESSKEDAALSIKKQRAGHY